ncbi:hypothetical protein Bbelb_070880 [Branchiostoma belcheri]|nr:hypothetical protein Bbelb_070880 [Branchiostoma belcheri]
MNVNLTLPVVLFLLFYLNTFRPTNSARSGCKHHRTFELRGHIWSVTDVTSDHCEWDIRTFPNKIILINFDISGFRRGSDNCTADVLTFHDGNSPGSRTIDTFSAFRRLEMSTASFGSQMYVVFNSNPMTEQRSDFNLTFTTRDQNDVPEFNEETFVPQTAPTFNQTTVEEFVKLDLHFSLTEWVHFRFCYSYSRSGDFLQVYAAIQDYTLPTNLESDIPYSCTYLSNGYAALGQLIVPGDRYWSPYDWPWFPFKTYSELTFLRTDLVMIYSFPGVEVGEEKSDQNTIECQFPLGKLTAKLQVKENPEVLISPPARELTDLRYRQELQLTCTAYKLDVTDITWSFPSGASVDPLPVKSSQNSSVLHINSLLPVHEGHVTCEALTSSGDRFSDVVDIRIVCEEDYWGELCDRVCNCTEPETCSRTLGCVCEGEGCPASQTVLLAISLSAGALILLLLGAIFLLYRHNNRLRVGNIDDPEVFQLGQDLKALMPPAAGSTSGSIDMELLKEKEIDRNRLQCGQLLGEGAFGRVVKATLTQPEEVDLEVMVAVKELKDDDDPQARQALLRETCIMLLCGNHDNVLGLKGICFRDGPLQLVLEYAEHGSLLHLLWTLRAESKLNRTVLVNKRHIFENMMLEVCCGLEHLATRRLVHRDIAARNILICGKGTAKIADFGLARDVYAVGYHRQDRVGQGRSRDMYAVGYHQQDRVPGHVRCGVTSAGQGRSRDMYAVGYHRQDMVGPGTCTLWGTIGRTGQGRSQDMYAVGYHRQDRVGYRTCTLWGNIGRTGQGWSRDVYAVGFHQQDRVGPWPGHVRCGLPSAGQGRSRGMYAVGYHRQDRVGPGTCTLWVTISRTGQGRSQDMYAVGYHRQDRVGYRTCTLWGNIGRTGQGWSRDVYAMGFHQQDRVGPWPGHVRCGLPSAGQGRSRGMYAVGYHRQDRQDRVGPGPGHVRCLVPSARQGRSRGMYAVGYHQQDRGDALLPLKWMAPESLKNEARFTHKSDVWSFGVLLWEVAQLGRTPYPGIDGADRIYDALQNHFRLPRPQLCTEERYQLMLKCWKFNEETRPDATTVRKLLKADPNGFFYFNAPVTTVEVNPI